MTAYSAILEAVISRDRSGKGDTLGISLFDVAAEWITVAYLHAEYGEGTPKPVGLRHPSIAPYGAFPCSDGRDVLISIQNELEWKRLSEEVLQSAAILNAPRNASNNDRVANREKLESDISAITSTLSSDELQDRLQRASIAYGVINTPEHLSAHPAFRSESVKNMQGRKYAYLLTQYDTAAKSPWWIARRHRLESTPELY